jgi:hypothetical protein
MHARMQGLDPAIKHLRETREVADILDRHLGLAERARGSAGGKDLDAKLGQALAEIQDAFLVRNRN